MLWSLGILFYFSRTAFLLPQLHKSHLKLLLMDIITAPDDTLLIFAALIVKLINEP